MSNSQINIEALPTFEELCVPGTWNRRYRELNELVHKNKQARELVVRVLNYFKTIKDLNFGERKMLDLAMNYDAIKVGHDKKVISINRKLNSLK